MNRGPKVQHTFSYESLRQADREDIFIPRQYFHFSCRMFVFAFSVVQRIPEMYIQNER